MRYTVRVERYKLAVDHGVAFHAFKRLGDFSVTVTDDLSIAAVQSDLAVLDFRDHAKPVILVLKNPSHIIEWGVRKRRKHRLQAFGQCRRAAHGFARVITRS